METGPLEMGSFLVRAEARQLGASWGKIALPLTHFRGRAVHLVPFTRASVIRQQPSQGFIRSCWLRSQSVMKPICLGVGGSLACRHCCNGQASCGAQRANALPPSFACRCMMLHDAPLTPSGQLW